MERFLHLVGPYLTAALCLWCALAPRACIADDDAADTTAAVGATDNAALPSTTLEVAAAKKIDFNHDVRPIFNQHCMSCHGGVKQAAGISFIRRATALAAAESGEVPIVPGDPEHSELVRRISADEDERMPPADHGRRLSDKEIATLRQWIAEGAAWREHWAYVKPVPPALPGVRDAAWCRQPLDHFVLARLERESLAPSREADRAQWLRRVTFDLTGLPPTIEELRAFDADKSDGAYEKVVDRLLASPAYGERWASMWLDLSRYADTVGFERDPPRNIWPYRDWLIRALNDDLPFDEFTVKQIAGDLLPDPSLGDLVATAFHRNTQNNTEGGSDDEEFRLQAVVDRINTTWQVWQGTTFGCTQCHSHPYAPFDNVEYYKFMAFFNNTRDCDVDEDYPLLDVPLDVAQWDAARALDRQIANAREEIFRRVSEVALDASTWKPLTPASARSTGSANLRLHTAEGRVEILAEGNISKNPVYTVDSPMPDGVTQLTALRIEALPLNIDAALREPEAGFVLSQFSAFVLSPNQKKPHVIPLAYVYCDEPAPLIDPQKSLQKNGDGWASYTRLPSTRAAYFVLKEPFEVAPEDRIRVQISQNRKDVSLAPLALHRFRLSLSDAEAWPRLHAEPSFVAEQESLAALRKERDAIPHVPIPVMQELDAPRARHTYRFERGNWLAKTDEVTADTPALLPPLPADATHDRLSLARWIASSDNPLTARVAVNRLWVELFGVGIVETAEDFGPAGTAPSNPELLDSLACRFSGDLGWSTKRLLREIVLSATYRQDAKGTPELRKRDAANHLLARGPRLRLTAEMVRDEALLASGLLTTTMYGPPVMPPQPEGVWRTVYNNQQWTDAEGPDRFRRGLYTYWKRTSAYPSFMAFDSPSREVCTARRFVTNTPLQALTTMNDEAYIEFARALGKRMVQEAGDDLAAQIRWACTSVTSNPPEKATIDDLTTLYREARDSFASRQADTTKLGETPEEAARTVMCNAILNFDAALVK